jgi:hypothetical protein
MLSIKALALPAAMLLLTACASAPAPDYPADHPANPQAAAAPVTPQPSPVAAYRSAQPAAPAGASPTDAQDRQKEDPHAGHH